MYHSIMEGEKSFKQFSPEVKVQDPSIRNAASLLPPILLFHGTGDYSIPSDARFEFYLYHQLVVGHVLCSYCACRSI